MSLPGLQAYEEEGEEEEKLANAQVEVDQFLDRLSTLVGEDVRTNSKVEEKTVASLQKSENNNEKKDLDRKEKRTNEEKEEIEEKYFNTRKKLIDELSRTEFEIYRDVRDYIAVERILALQTRMKDWRRGRISTNYLRSCMKRFSIDADSNTDEDTDNESTSGVKRVTEFEENFDFSMEEEIQKVDSSAMKFCNALPSSTGELDSRSILLYFHGELGTTATGEWFLKSFSDSEFVIPIVWRVIGSGYFAATFMSELETVHVLRKFCPLHPLARATKRQYLEFILKKSDPQSAYRKWVCSTRCANSFVRLAAKSDELQNYQVAFVIEPPPAELRNSSERDERSEKRRRKRRKRRRERTPDSSDSEKEREREEEKRKKKHKKENEQRVERKEERVETDEERKERLLREAERGLPSNWKAKWHKTTGKVFFYNKDTKQTTWNKPS